jgi:hypothetical protein
MPTPFDSLIVVLQEKIRARETSYEDLVGVCVQIRLLKVLFRAMHEYDMRKYMNWKDSKDVEASYDASTKAVLDYLQFINVLNQLGRILAEQNVYIPEFYRIRFFRNKVSEHWDDYTRYGTASGHTQISGEAAIPSTYDTYSPDERKEVKDEIDAILLSVGLSLEINNPEVANIADSQHEKIYSTLEKISPELHNDRIPKKLIELLFKFGFPAPIQNVRDYSNNLVMTISETKLVA